MDKRQRDARSSLRALTAIGLLLGFAGGLIAGLAWPGEEITTLGSVKTTGSAGLALVGLLAAWAGNVMLVVGLIGWGVVLGREAAPERTPTSAV